MLESKLISKSVISVPIKACSEKVLSNRY